MKNSSLVLLSGDQTSRPLAEAKALFLGYDGNSTIESPEPRVLVVESGADPIRIGRRIAFARRVGVKVEGPAEALPLLAGKKVRFRCFDLRGGRAQPDPADYLRGAESTIDLEEPDLELTLVRGEEDYLAVTSPGTMIQRWSTRRPRKRPFFHPSAIFPKLSRALVNLTRCKEGDVFVEPLAGTGSIAMEAFLVGAQVFASDFSERMVRGAHSNMKGFGEDWLGTVRADVAALPVTRADAVATDVPYGRAASTGGLEPGALLQKAIGSIGALLRTGSYAVLMHPQSIEVDGSGLFDVVEEHHLHVHKLLTRTISVLEKK